MFTLQPDLNKGHSLLPKFLLCSVKTNRDPTKSRLSRGPCSYQGPTSLCKGPLSSLYLYRGPIYFKPSLCLWVEPSSSKRSLPSWLPIKVQCSLCTSRTPLYGIILRVTIGHCTPCSISSKLLPACLSLSSLHSSGLTQPHL